MADVIAFMLDEVSFRKEWRDKVTSIINTEALRVSPGYAVMVTVANRSYSISSDKTGRLAVSPIAFEETAKFLSNAQVRMVVDATALGNADELRDWSEVMLQKRKIRFEGDQHLFNELKKELDPLLATLTKKIEDSGPSALVVQNAIKEHNKSIALKNGDVTSGIEKQLAYLSEDDMQPLMQKVAGWVLFSAVSSMQGNMGQTNYCASNQILDALSFQSRTEQNYCFEAVSLMWGAVASIGMRWKAFASADMLLQLDNSDDVLMTHLEAQACLRLVIGGSCPEWACAWKQTKEYNDYFMLGWKPGPWPGKDAWGRAAGGGVCIPEPSNNAGISFRSGNTEKLHGSDEGHDMRPEKSNGWLFPGRRVRTHSLAFNTDLNGAMGTLVEQLEPGTWHVLLDDGLGEHKLRVKNLMTLSGIPLDSSYPKMEKAMTTPLKPQESDVKPEMAHRMARSTISITEKNPRAEPCSHSELLCIAGTWDDWMPIDMVWDETQQCHRCEVDLNSTAETKFGVNRGKAGTKKWNVRPKQWSMGKVSGRYEIKVFLKNRSIQKVDWARMA